jgi:hypothetical protein
MPLLKDRVSYLEFMIEKMQHELKNLHEEKKKDTNVNVGVSQNRLTRRRAI